MQGEAVDYYRHIAYRKKHEVLLSELSQQEQDRFFTVDEYGAENQWFQALGYDIEVKDLLLAEAIQSLPEKKQPGRNHGVRHALTLEQQRAFVNYIESNPQFCRWTALFKFLLGTGCRIGEAIGIRWEDVEQVYAVSR